MDKQVPKNITYQSGCNIKVIFEPENVIKTTLEVISEAKEKFDCCLDNRGLSYFIENEQVF
jgi:hypothetical protein